MVKKVQKSEAQKMNDINEEVPTILSLLEYDENVMSDVQKEILEDEIAELSSIQEGQLNVSGIYAYDTGEKLEVKAYIRNGLSKKIVLEQIPLVITNSKGEILAYQIFNLQSLGEIPEHTARPLKILFERKNIFVDKIPMDDWELGFDTRIKAERNVKVHFEGLPKEIDIEDKLVYDKFLRGLPDLREGQFSISPFSVGIQKDGNMLVTVVMRNGNSKPISIDKIPVSLKDPKGNVVKSNLFELNKFTVSPLKAKLCNFMFPTNLQLEKDIALEGWEVVFKLEEPVKAPDTEEASV